MSRSSLGLAYTMHEGGFIRVELVSGCSSSAMKTIANWYNVLASGAYAVIVLYYIVKFRSIPTRTASPRPKSPRRRSSSRRCS